jgi:hypothetical protein
MAVADTLREAVQDLDRLGIASRAAHGPFGPAEQGAEIDFPLAGQPLDIGISGIDRLAHSGEIGEPGFRAPARRLRGRRRGCEKQQAERQTCQ